MSYKPIVSFPQMDHYPVPIKYFLEHILPNAEIMIPPKITQKTIETGTKHSPDFVCTPFKYTLGTLIEALDKGANIVIQAGGGCRYGYYSELQEKILQDLGYQFKYINLVEKGQTDLKKAYNDLKMINPNLKAMKCLYYGWITAKMIKYMDKVDDYIRQNIGFETKKGSFLKLQKEMLNHFSTVKNYRELHYYYRHYFKKIKKLPTNKPKNCLKIGIIGELYTLMEPFANYNLEMELAAMNIEVKRYTNVRYLVFEKGKKIKKYLKYTKDYIKYQMGADAADNIARAKYLCTHNYDGIIHIKSSFCTPEIGAMPIINKICQQYNVPVIYFSFDSNTSEIGIKTRLEAFYDMLEMRKKHD